MKKQKKDKPTTIISVILDKSGSMGGREKEIVAGYNEQIQQAKLSSKDQNILFNLISFNGEVSEHHWGQKVEELQEATVEDYQPEGSTALRDAVGYTIDKLLKTTDPTDPNVAYLVIIMSDGAENASRHYSPYELQRVKSQAEEHKNFTFTYMGCSEAIVKQVAAEYSIPLSNCAVWSNNSVGSTEFAYKASNKRMSEKYLSARSVGKGVLNDVYSDTGGMANFAPEEAADSVVPDVSVVTPDKFNITNTVDVQG